MPLDYARPGADDLRLAVIKLPATGARRGALVVNPGGPGVSGVAYARYAEQVISPDVREHFDVVGFDPRGVGASAPVDCVGDAVLGQLVAAPPAPRTPAQVRDAVTLAKRFDAGCARHAGRLLPHLGTVDAARDLDVLRAALGESRLTYLGKSYGTYLGATYAELFPRRLRAAVLDGALDPALTLDELNRGQALGFETDLGDFLRSCGAAHTCGSSPGAAAARLDALFARVARSSLPAAGRRLTSGTATYGVLQGLYSPALWPRLAAAVASAERGDGAGLLALADALAGGSPDGHYSNEVEANTAINCVDRPASRSVSSYTRAAAGLAKVAPHFGPAVVWGSLPCAFWPVPASVSPHPVSAPGAPPVLVVGTTRDPATPYPWAVALHRELPGALLTRVGDGHTAYRVGNGCIDAAVDAYLLSLRLPAAGTRCR